MKTNQKTLVKEEKKWITSGSGKLQETGSTRDQDLYPKRQHREGPSQRLTKKCRQQTEASMTVRTHGFLALHMAALLSQNSTCWQMRDPAVCIWGRRAGELHPRAQEHGNGLMQSRGTQLLKVLAWSKLPSPEISILHMGKTETHKAN